MAPGRLSQAGRMHAAQRRILRQFLESEEAVLNSLQLAYCVSSFGFVSDVVSLCWNSARL